MQWCAVSRESYDNVKMKWFPEVHHHCPGRPTLLVGTKHDLRSCTSETVSTDEGWALARAINVTSYVECSAKTRFGIDNVFKTVADLFLLPNLSPKRKRRRCILL